MLSGLRAGITRIFTPLARALLRRGVSPDAVTVVGTFGVALAALWLYPLGHLLAGTLVITAFVFSDSLDGVMARLAGRASAWGSFLDSTLDRVADAAIFSGLILYFLLRTDDHLGAGLAVACLALGALVPYARAKAESLGMTASVGIAERADRLVAVLVASFLVGLGVPRVLLVVVLALLALASAVTVLQRIQTVHRQATGSR